MENIIWLKANRNLSTSIISFEVLFNGDDRRITYSNHRYHKMNGFLIRTYRRYYQAIIDKITADPRYKSSDVIWNKLKQWAHTDMPGNCVTVPCRL